MGSEIWEEFGCVIARTDCGTKGRGVEGNDISSRRRWCLAKVAPLDVSVSYRPNDESDIDTEYSVLVGWRQEDQGCKIT